MGKPFKPTNPLSFASIARLLSLFAYREGEDCKATQEARRILQDPELGGRDQGIQATIIDQLHQLRGIHRAYDGTDVDHRSRAGKNRRGVEGSGQKG